MPQGLPAKPPLLFSDAELQDLASDPSITPQDLAKLSPEQQQKVQGYRRGTPPDQGLIHSGLNAALDLGTGAAKGAAKIVPNSAKAVRAIPGVGALTERASDIDKVFGGGMPGVPNGGPPVSAMLEGLLNELKPTNTTQRVGEGLEQAGEFVAAGGPTRAAVKAGLTRPALTQISKLGSVNANHYGGNLATVLGEMLGAGGSAGTISAAHGNENPDTVAAIAAGGPPTAAATAALVNAIATNPALAPLKFLLPYIMGGAAMTGLGGVTPLGLSGGLGVGAGTRATVNKVLRDPNTRQTVTDAIRRLLPEGFMFGAGAEDVRERQRP